MGLINLNVLFDNSVNKRERFFEKDVNKAKVFDKLMDLLEAPDGKSQFKDLYLSRKGQNGQLVPADGKNNAGQSFAGIVNQIEDVYWQQHERRSRKARARRESKFDNKADKEHKRNDNAIEQARAKILKQDRERKESQNRDNNN